MIAISSQSTQYVQVPITNTESISPTSDAVSFAFIGPYASTSQAADNPPTSATTWTAGSWNATATATAQILVGPSGGAVTLGVGSYQVWVKITDSPEVPILYSGPMVVS